MSRVWVIALWMGILLDAGCSKQGSTTVACTPPMTNWEKPGPFYGLMPVMNKVALDSRGMIYWNGQRVSFSELSELLGGAGKMDPQPITFLETEMGAPCKTLDAIRNEMNRTLNCERHGPCGEGIMTVWQAMPNPPERPVS